MQEPYDYWQTALADEEKEAQMREMARETAASVRVAGIVVLAAFGGLIIAGGVCVMLTWLMLRAWAA